jgi:hypothetical protein
LIGAISGLVCILILYALLPDDYRSSRVIILAGTIISLIVSNMTSFLFRNYNSKEKPKNILIVASDTVANSIKISLEKAEVNSNILGVVNPIPNTRSNLNYLNDISQLGALSKMLKADEIIFSTENLEMREIMRQMMKLDTKLSFKIAGDDSLSILGSNSKNTTGELYNVNIKYNLADGYYKHLKRISDFSIGLILLLLFPLLLLINKFRVIDLLKHIIQLIFGIKTLVGYSGDLADYQNLPELSPCILTLPKGTKDGTLIDNIQYAKDYSGWMDLELLVKNLNKLA